MNRDRYRTIFSKRLGTLVAVAETTKAQGKGSGSALGSSARVSRQAPASQSLGRMSAVSLGVALALWGPAAFASPPLPTGGMITSGSGTISQNGNTLAVNQSSQSLAANWQSFDIDAGHSVVFNQPNSSSVALNRVIGPDASAIYGSLSANGKVFLVNPNGVLFAPGAQVSVGGLVASTLKISDEDFAAGRYRFTEGSGAGSLVNQGEITAESVALIAPKIVNSGAIRTPGGNTTLAAGDRVTVSMLNGLLTAEVDAAVVGAEIHNHGQIVATGGEVKMLAGRGDAVVDSLINVDGVLQASSIRNENGKVYLDGGAGGTVDVSGTLDVSATQAGAHGGNVIVLGKNVGLMQGARIDASGDSGGGTVLVGGNWQGSGPEHHAQSVSMSETAVIEANAINRGSGGKVVLWSDGATAFHGRIEATGVDSGGRVETSGHDLDISGGRVSTLAADGSAGEWLLDPVNVTISTSPTSSSGSAPDYSGTASGANVNVTDLLTALASNNVTISTGVAGAEAGNISVDAAINYTSTTPRTLSFISTGSGGLTGSSTIGGASGALSVVVDQAGSSTFNGLIQGTGSFTKLGAGTLTLTNQNAYSGGTTVSAGTLIARRGGGNNETIAPFGSGSIAVAAGATAVVDNTPGSGYNFFNNEFTGAGTVSYRGSSVNRLISPATLSGFTGTVSIDQNIVQLWGANTTAALNVGGGTFAVWSLFGNPTFGALTGNGTVAGVPGGGGGTLSIGNGGSSATFSGVISNASGQMSLVKVGSGTQTLTGANTYAGTTTINAGVLQVGSGANTGTIGTSSATVNTGGTLRWFRNDTHTINNAISGAGTLSLLGTGTSNQSSYALGGNNSGFTGTVIVDRSRLTYDSANDLGSSANIDVLTGGSVFATASIVNPMRLNGTGWNETGGPRGALRLQNGAIASGNITLQSDAWITAFGSTGTVSGVISGSAALQASGGGTGTLTLSGANTFTGPLTIRHGTNAITTASVILAPTGSLATADVRIGTASSNAAANTFAVLQTQGTNQLPNAVVSFDGLGVNSRWAYWQLLGTNQSVAGVNDSSANGVIENTESQAGFGAATLTLTGSGNYSFNGYIRNNTGAGGSGALAIVKNGTGVQTLSGGNINHSGATTVNGGTLSLFNPSTYQSATTVNGGAVLELAGNANAQHSAGFSLTLNDGATLNKTSTASNEFNSSNVTINGTVAVNVTNSGNTNQLYIGGTGGTGLTGSGTINLTNTDTDATATTRPGLTLRRNAGSFAGTINVSGGTLYVGTGGGLALQNTDLNLTNGAQLNMAGSSSSTTEGATNTSVKSLAGGTTATVALGTRTLTVGTNDGTGANFAGVISGTGALLKSGTGTQTLSGNNTYSGTTTVNGGALQVGNDGTTGTLGAGAVTNNANLVFNRSDSTSLGTLAAGGISGTGNVTALIGGDFNVDRAIALSGANSTILLEAGKAVPAGTVAGGNVTLSSNVSTSATGTLTIFSGNATTGAYEARVSGADGLTRYKTYSASAGDTAGGITGTRNYYYRQQPSTLTVSGLTATKVYDGLLNANAVDDSAAIVHGTIDGDSLAVSSLTLLGAQFDSAHAGPRTLNASFAGAAPSYSSGGATWSITGYSSANITTSGTGTITPRPVSTSINAVGRDYNGLINTTSTLAAPTGFIGNDNATGVAGLLLAFDDPNAGARNVVASGTGVVTGFSGASSGNGSGVGVGNEVAGLASDYVVATPTPASAVITPASLTVTANDDAKIITQSDEAGYNGVSFSGFVNGESAADLGGTLAITRSNAGTESVGDYAGVLVPTGYSSSNYAISYVNGGYRILPAEQLLVRIQNISTAYGAAASYVVTGAEYLDGSGTSLHALTQTAHSGTTYTFSDGLGGSATFTISPEGAVLSSAGHLAVGNYELSGIDASIAGSNFSGLNYVGNHTVTPIGLTPLLGTVGKVYDGTTSMTGTTLGLTRLLAGDQVLVQATGAFHSRNVGSSVGYDISNIALSGADAGNYYLTTGALSGTDGAITPRAITLTGISAIDRIYDGTIAASLTTSGYGFDGLVTGDAVTLDASNYSVWFDSKHVGMDKAVTVTGFALSGADAGNYVLTQPAALTADITPRPLTITAIAAIKTFDGWTNAIGIPIVTGELASGDTFTLLGQEYATANVGTGLTLTPIVGIDDGNGGANYALTLVNNTAGEIRPGIDLSQVGGSQTSARLNGDGASAENGTSGDSASGVCVRGGNRNGCGEGEASGAMIQVRSTGIRLPSGLADAESSRPDRPL